MKRNVDFQFVRRVEFYSADVEAADRIPAGRTGRSPMFLARTTIAERKWRNFPIRDFCSHLNPLPQREEDANRQARVVNTAATCNFAPQEWCKR